MLTLSIRYAFSPDKLEAFKSYVEAEQEPIILAARSDQGPGPHYAEGTPWD